MPKKKPSYVTLDGSASYNTSLRLTEPVARMLDEMCKGTDRNRSAFMLRLIQRTYYQEFKMLGRVTLPNYSKAGVEE